MQITCPREFLPRNERTKCPRADKNALGQTINMRQQILPVTWTHFKNVFTYLLVHAIWKQCTVGVNVTQSFLEQNNEKATEFSSFCVLKVEYFTFFRRK